MTTTTEAPHFQTVVIGAGPGGICAGIKLKERHLDDFVILERAHDVGGSWRDNHYPGLGVDIPGITYQYSFAPNPGWSSVFPKGAEVWQYHRDVAEKFGLLPHLRFGVTVTRESWDEDSQWWNLQLADGSTITARFVISAIGAFLIPKDDPGIPGYEDFLQKVLRPAQWDHDYDLRGKRVAVVGTGASSVQITPAIAGDVAHLDVYQRTPVWCLPKPDFRMRAWMTRLVALPAVLQLLRGLALGAIDITMRIVVFTPEAVFRPAAKNTDRGARALYRLYLHSVVHNPRNRQALAPGYGIAAKRPTLSNHFLQAFNRDNVELHTTPIERITATGVRTIDGVEHPVDALVLATGYDLFSDPESYREDTVVGRDGFDLGRFFAEHRLQAYQGVSLPGLPNRWILVGPYSWTGTGWHTMVEISAGHAANVIAETLRRGAGVAEISADAHARYHRMIVSQGANLRYYFTVLNKGLRTYYVNSQGDIPYIRPTSVLQAIRASNRVDYDDYTFGALKSSAHHRRREAS